MPKVSAIYRFKRDPASHSGFLSKNDPATDAAGVVHNWATMIGRSAQTIVDDQTVFIARLTFDGERKHEAADDLNQRCAAVGLVREMVADQEAGTLGLKATREE